MNPIRGDIDFLLHTGMLYSEYNQPQFCAELKAEIDRLSLSGSNLLEPSQGRTLGTASDILKHLNQHTKGLLLRCHDTTGLRTASTCSVKWLHAHSILAGL